MFFTEIQWILVGLQIRKRVVEQRLKLHNLRIHHVMIHSDLRSLIRAKVAGTVKWNHGAGYNPAKNPRIYVWSGQQPHKGKPGRVFGWVWNQTKPNRWSQPGPLVGYPDLSQTLNISMCCIAYNDWVYNGYFDVFNVSVTRGSTISSLPHSTIKELHCLVPTKSMHRLAL